MLKAFRLLLKSIVQYAQCLTMLKAFILEIKLLRNKSHSTRERVKNLIKSWTGCRSEEFLQFRFSWTQRTRWFCELIAGATRNRRKRFGTWRSSCFSLAVSTSGMKCKFKHVSTIPSTLSRREAGCNGDLGSTAAGANFHDRRCGNCLERQSRTICIY